MKKIGNIAVFKNASWLIAGKIFQMGISVVVGIISARYLGPANYGLINYAGAYTAFFLALCTLGINSVLVEEFANHPGEEGTIIGSTLFLRAISSFISAALIVCIVSVVERDEPLTIVVTALCSLSLLFNIFDTFNYWFQSKLQSKVTAIVLLVGYVATALYKVLLLILQKDVRWFAFANVLDYICVGILLLYSYKKYNGEKLSISKSVSARILSKSVHFILPSLMVSIYGYADKFMLKQMLNEEATGYYSTAIAACGMWTFVLTAIIDSFYPYIIEAHKRDHEEFEKRNRQLYAIVFYISVFVSVILCIFGKFIIGILYGEEFIKASDPLRIITWYTAFSYLGVARNVWIVCENKQRCLKYIYFVSAIMNVVLNYLTIPILGATGAALASLITQIATSLVVPLFIKEIRPNTILMLQGICCKKIR